MLSRAVTGSGSKSSKSVNKRARNIITVEMLQMGRSFIWDDMPEPHGKITN